MENKTPAQVAAANGEQPKMATITWSAFQTPASNPKPPPQEQQPAPDYEAAQALASVSKPAAADAADADDKQGQK